MNKRNVILTGFVLLAGFVALNFATPNNTLASTPIERPVPTADDGINQFYLYGGENVLTGVVHRGIDFTPNITLGDSVRAVAAGRVVDLVETNAKGCSPSGTPNCNDYGNYVLIRHDQRHYDATTTSTGYVYSLYMHLKQNSVNVNVNDAVTAQQIIAQADDTGNSSGHHLHLQIIIHNLSDRTLATIDPENRTRNPELWLKPLGNTAKLAGRVSDSNGNPIPDKIIQGIQKDVGLVSLLTYDVTSHPELKSDDLIFENFATTDISPGPYCLQVVSIEFLHRTDTSTPQNPTQNYTLAPNERKFIASSSIFYSTSWVGSVRITANKPVAAKLYETQSTHTNRSYNATASGNSILYVPAAYKGAFGFTTGLVIQNLGTLSTNITLRYCERLVTNPANCPTEVKTVAPLRAVGVNLTAAPIPTGWTGSVSIQSSNGTLLAAAVTNSLVDQTTGATIGGYDFNASGRSFKKIYLPLVEKAYGSTTTGFTIRNTSGVTINSLQADYYRNDGTYETTRNLLPVVNGTPQNLLSAQVVGYYQGNDTFLPNGWVGSIVINASNSIQVTMREDVPGSGGTTSGYNGIGE